MFFYIIIFLSIFIPYFAPKRYKRISLVISFFLLFLLWGFQYEVVNDWYTNLGRWDYVNYGIESEYCSRDLELFYTWILKTCKPISYYGFLILSAIVAESVLFIIIIRYVSPKYYWVAIFILTIIVSHMLLYVNSNRQCWALMSTIIALYVLLNERRLILKYGLSFTFIFIAGNIHAAAWAFLLVYPIYWICNKKNANTLILFIICNFIYIIHFFTDLTSYQGILITALEGSDLQSLGHYFEDLSTYKDQRFGSVWQQICPLLTMNLSIYFYNRMRLEMKVMSLCYIFSFLLGGFLVATLKRMLMPFSVYEIILVPCLIRIVLKKFSDRDIWKYVFILIALYMTLQFGKYTAPDSRENAYTNWSEYKSVFSAPRWY